jgi:hypothetical protein
MFRYDKHNYIDETQATLHLTPGSEEVLYLVIIQMYVEQKHLKQNFVSLINTNILCYQTFFAVSNLKEI